MSFQQKNFSLVGVGIRGVMTPVKCNETIFVSNWVNQAAALAALADCQVVLGLRVGTALEICNSKWFGGYPVGISRRRSPWN